MTKTTSRPGQECSEGHEMPRSQIRVCPHPPVWSKVGKKLLRVSGATRFQSSDAPPTPLVLSGWWYTNDLAKKSRWEATVRWATERGLDHIIGELGPEDFYCTSELSTYEISPLGGPMYRRWDSTEKQRPSDEDICAALQLLRIDWQAIVGSRLGEICKPVEFTGAKARRLIVEFDPQTTPPWGSWNQSSPHKEERRTFTAFRHAINAAISPLEVDHVEFDQRVPSTTGGPSRR